MSYRTDEINRLEDRISRRNDTPTVSRMLRAALNEFQRMTEKQANAKFKAYKAKMKELDKLLENLTPPKGRV